MSEAPKEQVQGAEKLPGRICACGAGVLVGDFPSAVERLRKFEEDHESKNVTAVTAEEYERRFGKPSPRAQRAST